MVTTTVWIQFPRGFSFLIEETAWKQTSILLKRVHVGLIFDAGSQISPTAILRRIHPIPSELGS